ncbi:MAG TPA: prolyl oligopeptidase family serine peptidase [Thermoanaerobaculia bacterium]|nr:prolyl oligopeptidase family serine peptidase [Thermoanaerobaculia bacterium]
MHFRERTIDVEGRPSSYRLYVPPDLEPPLPLILFLHGRGESGDDGLKPTTVGIGPAIERDPERFPALVVFPQASLTYGWRGWNLLAAVAALDDVEQTFDVDLDRVYVTGLSMGGFGTWAIAALHSKRFAAVVPICGGFDGTATQMRRHEAAALLAGVPQWAFHGDADDVVTVEHSRKMVEALRAAGSNIRYTEYEGVKHNSWDRAYAEPELLPWTLAQRR